MMLLLDTHVVSEAREGNCDPNVQTWMVSQAAESMYISAITVLEIQRGISQVAHSGDDLQVTVLTRWLDGTVLPAFAGRILPVDHVDHVDHVKHFEAAAVPLINPWMGSP